MYVCITELFCFTSETNTIYQIHFNKNKIKKRKS